MFIKFDIYFIICAALSQPFFINYTLHKKKYFSIIIIKLADYFTIKIIFSMAYCNLSYLHFYILLFNF